MVDMKQVVAGILIVLTLLFLANHRWGETVIQMQDRIGSGVSSLGGSSLISPRIYEQERARRSSAEYCLNRVAGEHAKPFEDSGSLEVTSEMLQKEKQRRVDAEAKLEAYLKTAKLGADADRVVTVMRAPAVANAPPGIGKYAVNLHFTPEEAAVVDQCKDELEAQLTAAQLEGKVVFVGVSVGYKNVYQKTKMVRRSIQHNFGDRAVFILIHQGYEAHQLAEIDKSSDINVNITCNTKVLYKPHYGQPGQWNWTYQFMNDYMQGRTDGWATYLKFLTWLIPAQDGIIFLDLDGCVVSDDIPPRDKRYPITGYICTRNMNNRRTLYTNFYRHERDVGGYYKLMNSAARQTYGYWTQTDQDVINTVMRPSHLHTEERVWDFYSHQSAGQNGKKCADYNNDEWWAANAPK